VILTTAAAQALDADQLDAVLAHERAHLAGRHHRLLALARIGREVFPFLPLMRDAEQQVARLVELHADDAATRARDPGCSPRPWSCWPRPPVPRRPLPRVPPTRCSGFTGSWDPPSHWAAHAGSCFAPPPRRSPWPRCCWP
jgi:Peptidase family M48